MFTFANVQFYIFIGILLLFYHFVPKKYRWVTIGFGNLAFIYFSNSFGMFLFSLYLFLFVYGVGLLLDKKRDSKHFSDYLAFAIIIIIFILFIVKYELIWISAYNLYAKLINIESLQLIDLLAPFGISYFVLCFISYLCDVYWGMISAERNPLKLFSVIMFFPILTSGPIIKYGENGENIFAGNDITYSNLCFGLQRLGWGVFKKIVISERLGVIVDTIYSNYDKYNGFYVLIAVWLFVLQLYTDFSGCIDIMLGIAQIFGIKLPENFDYPFSSKTVAELWRRWHITLGRCLKEYVFYPLLRSETWRKMGKTFKKIFGKKASSKITTDIALFISWFLIGAWHGGGLNYIFGSGIFMGIVIIISDALEPSFTKIKVKLHINDQSILWGLFQRIRTFLLFSFGLSFFRAKDLRDGINLWKSLFANFNPHIFMDGSIFSLGLSEKNLCVLLVSLIVMFVFYGISYRQKKDIRELLSEKNIIIRWTLYIILIWVIFVFGNYGPGYNASDFIYEKF